jgi:hypothetical protein
MRKVTKMTIDEMIEELESARDDLGGDAPVRIAYQPSWPLRATVASVTVPPSDDPAELYPDDEEAAGQDNDGHVLWIAAGSAPYDENPYAPKWAWRESSEIW